ncbi:hypothetical protein ACRAWD_23955 [Caulobacter segnis]
MKTYPHVDLELLTGTRLFSLAQREADIAFRIVPFDAPDIVQRRLIRLTYGAYVATDLHEPVFGDGAGFSLVTMDTLGGTVSRHRLAAGKLSERSNGSGVEQSQRPGPALPPWRRDRAVLPQVVGDQTPGLRRLRLPLGPTQPRYLDGLSSRPEATRSASAPSSRR